MDTGYEQREQTNKGTKQMNNKNNENNSFRTLEENLVGFKLVVHFDCFDSYQTDATYFIVDPSGLETIFVSDYESRHEIRSLHPVNAIRTFFKHITKAGGFKRKAQPKKSFVSNEDLNKIAQNVNIQF